MARNPTFWFQSDNETQRAKDESNLSGSAGSPDGNASPSEQNELSQSVSQSQTLEQQEALEVLKSQQMNSSALLSNILKNRQSKGKLQELEETQKAEEKNYGQAQSFLSQNLQVPQQSSIAWASKDNYASNKLNRKQLRQETRNDAYFVPQEVEEGKANRDSQASEFTPREGWEYVRSQEESAWFGWRQESPVRTHGVQLESKEVLRSLRSAFPKNLVEGESFALKDDLGSVVSRAGQPPAKSERIAQVTVPVGGELPGWELDAFRVLPAQVVLPPTELPDEGLVNKSFSLGSSIEGEWGGYLVFSSVIALILVAALLLGGSVLLIQVRRNSLEAVRKTTFVSNASHELKTPLTTIRMYGEMLGDGIVKDETKKKGYLETIISESQRLTRLVNNVLDFGRLERGEKTYNREEIVLGSAVENILETQRPRLESAGLELEWVDDSQGAMAKLDPDALEQVLLNLLDNLVKYAVDGKYAGVRLKKQAETVSMEISDLGPGIPSEQRERIFETFHRVDDSLTSNKPGCGIGLGIAKKLVEDMEGQITCEANKPKGPGSESYFHNQAKMKKKILVAEDDSNIRSGLLDALEADGHEAEGFPDGASAIAAFRQDKWDLLLLDIMMPEKSGYEVAREVRATGSEVPILMLTAKSEEIDKVLGFEMGTDDYVTKPFSVRELLARIKALLRRSGKAGSTDKAGEPPANFSMGPVEVDARRYEMKAHGQTHSLTPVN